MASSASDPFSFDSLISAATAQPVDFDNPTIPEPAPQASKPTVTATATDDFFDFLDGPKQPTPAPALAQDASIPANQVPEAASEGMGEQNGAGGGQEAVRGEEPKQLPDGIEVVSDENEQSQSKPNIVVNVEEKADAPASPGGRTLNGRCPVLDEGSRTLVRQLATRVWYYQQNCWDFWYTWTTRPCKQTADAVYKPRMQLLVAEELFYFLEEKKGLTVSPYHSNAADGDEEVCLPPHRRFPLPACSCLPAVPHLPPTPLPAALSQFRACGTRVRELQEKWKDATALWLEESSAENYTAMFVAERAMWEQEVLLMNLENAAARVGEPNIAPSPLQRLRASFGDTERSDGKSVPYVPAPRKVSPRPSPGAGPEADEWEMIGGDGGNRSHPNELSNHPQYEELRKAGQELASAQEQWEAAWEYWLKDGSTTKHVQALNAQRKMLALEDAYATLQEHIGLLPPPVHNGSYSDFSAHAAMPALRVLERHATLGEYTAITVPTAVRQKLHDFGGSVGRHQLQWRTALASWLEAPTAENYGAMFCAEREMWIEEKKYVELERRLTLQSQSESENSPSNRSAATSATAAAAPAPTPAPTQAPAAAAPARKSRNSVFSAARSVYSWAHQVTEDASQALHNVKEKDGGLKGSILSRIGGHNKPDKAEPPKDAAIGGAAAAKKSGK